MSRAKEEKRVTKALKRNRYIMGLIRRHTRSTKSNQVSNSNGRRASLTLSYLSGLLESLCRVLSPLAIHVTFHPFRTLWQELVHSKDSVPYNRMKGVVCSIPCAKCPRAYIRQTGRSLDHALQEYRCALKNRGCT